MKTSKCWLLDINNKINKEESGIIQIEKIRTKSAYNWRNPDEYFHEDSKSLNKFAYFDYQQSKVYLRSNKNHKKIANKSINRQKINYKINEIININPEYCSYCGYKKFHLRKEYQKIIIDIKFMKNGIKRWVREYKSGSFICNKCKERFSIINFNKMSHYGDNLIKWSMNLHIKHHVSYNNIKDILSDLNIHVGEANIYDFKTMLSNIKNKSNF